MKNWQPGFRGWFAGFVALGALACSSDAPKHWSALEQCLIGGPLGKNENIFQKLRGVQLAESLASSGGKDAWPQRCAPYATALHDSLSDSGKPGMIKRALQEQLVCDGACKFPESGHPLPAADKLWEAVQRAELERVDAPGVPKPKPPKTSLVAEDWPVLSSGQIIDKRWSPSGALWLLLKSEKGHRWCTLEGARGRCVDVQGAPKFHSSAPLNLVRGSSTPILAGSVFSEEHGLGRTGFALDTKKPVPLFGETGHEAFTGVGFAQQELETDERPDPDKPPPAPKFDVARVEQGEPRAKATLALTARVRGPEVVEGWLVYVERDADQKTVFKARELGEGGRLFGSTEVEHTGEFPGPFKVCLSKPGAAIGSYVEPIRALGKKVSGKNEITVTLLEGKTWHEPVGFAVPKQVGQFSGWRCGAGWGGFSWLEQVDGKLTVTELVCKSSGCKTKKVSWAQPDLKNVLALDYVQDKVLVLYQSVAGDTRHRLAELSKLPTAESALTFENSDFGGVDVQKPLLAVADQTYLLLSDGGLRALYFDGTEATPVKP